MSASCQPWGLQTGPGPGLAPAEGNVPDLFLAYPVPPAGPPGTHLPQRPGPVSELKEICRLKPGRQHPTGWGRPRTCLPGSQCSGEKAPVGVEEEPARNSSFPWSHSHPKYHHLHHSPRRAGAVCSPERWRHSPTVTQHVPTELGQGAGSPGLAQGSSTQPPCYHYKHILAAAEHSTSLHPAGCSVFASVISCVVPTSQRKMLSLREVM